MEQDCNLLDNELSGTGSNWPALHHLVREMSPGAPGRTALQSGANTEAKSWMQPLILMF